MKYSTAVSAFAGLLLTVQLASAEAPKVERNVGSDGVPVISITGQKAPQASQAKSEPTEIQPRKAFRVYEMQGDPSPPQPETKVVVVSSPPPIAPNNGYGWGYGYGYPIDPYYSGGFYSGDGFYSGFYPAGGYGLPVGSYLNYQTPPLNYQNPPINYQNPPANYRPIYRGGGGYYPGRRCR